MKRRRLLLLTLLTAALTAAPVLTAAPASAVQPFACRWTTTATDPGGLRWDVLITAGPLVEAGSTAVTTICELRRDAMNGPVFYSESQTTPGSAGFFEDRTGVYATGHGIEIYICTRTIAIPSGARHDLGCDYVLTS